MPKSSTPTPLQERLACFNRMATRNQFGRPSPLIASWPLPEARWRKLRNAAALYLSKCLPGNQLILDEAELLAALEAQQHDVKNITPNGMVVPKRHTILEYNLLVRAFAEVVSDLGVNDLISSWHVPLNLRVKFGTASEHNLGRHHPTEHIHSDSWAGESAESVTTHLPIFGDLERNHLVFYEPPADFEESWLGPLPTYQAGAHIAARYNKLAFTPRKGELVLADFAGLHSSSRLPDAGTRVSIDTTFHLRRIRETPAEVIHPWRVEERASPQVMEGLGQTHLFVFPDGVDDQVDSRGGFKHPTNLKVVKLLEP